MFKKILCFFGKHKFEDEILAINGEFVEGVTRCKWCLGSLIGFNTKTNYYDHSIKVGDVLKWEG